MGAFASPATHALDPARVLICMLYDDAAAHYGDIAADINRRYAARHGFAFHVRRQKGTYFAHLSPAWQKVGLIRELLHAPEYDVVVWVDADAAFQHAAADQLSSSSPPSREAAAIANSDARPAPHSLASILQHFLLGRKQPQLMNWFDRLMLARIRNGTAPEARKAARKTRVVAKDVLLSRDRAGPLNTGVMAFRDTPHAHAFLDRLADVDRAVAGSANFASKRFRADNLSDPVAKMEIRCAVYSWRRNWEQTCIQVLYDVNADRIQQHAAIVPYGVLQSAVAPTACARPQAAIVHFMVGGSHLDANLRTYESDREHGLGVLRDWLQTDNATLRATTLKDLPLLPPRRKPLPGWIANTFCCRGDTSCPHGCGCPQRNATNGSTTENGTRPVA